MSGNQPATTLTTPNEHPCRGTIENLINPSCVAILGVTDSRPTWGSKALRLCGEGGYRGRLYGVNPRGSLEGFEGFPIVSDLGDIQPPVDCALIGLGREQVLRALEQCAENGVKSAVVVAAGFGELGAEGRRLEAAMLDVAEQSGLRILGPNCIGLFRSGGGICLTPFAMPAGTVGLISQSGNVAISLALQGQRMGFGFSTCVGVGNQLDISFGEVLSWFADDPETNQVAMYIEGIPDRAAAEFIEGLRQCHIAGKPVFILRGGSTPEGSDTVGTHTGSLATDTRVWSAVVENEHAIAVASESALADVLLAAQLPHFEGGTVVLTDGGGNSVMAVDSLSRCGLPLASLSSDTQAALLAALPPLAPRHEGLNPVTLDTPGGLQDGPMLLATCAEICAKDPGVGLLVIGGLFGGYQEHRPEEIDAARRLAGLRVSGVAIAVASAYAGIEEGSLSGLRQAGVPVYGCTDRLAIAVASRYQPTGGATAPPCTTTRHSPLPPNQPSRGWLNAADAAERLRAARLPIPIVRIARSPNQLADACAEVGYPLCLKVDSEDISHKSDVGGVKLGIETAAAARAAADDLWRRFRDARVLVMPMLPGGLELLAGLSWDPTFGPIAVVGRGGIWTEVEDDVVVLPVGLTAAEIAAGISRLRCFPMIAGSRGQTPLDLAALADVVSALGQLAKDEQRLEVDLNPVILYPQGLAIADFRVSSLGQR